MKFKILGFGFADAFKGSDLEKLLLGKYCTTNDSVKPNEDGSYSGEFLVDGDDFYFHQVYLSQENIVPLPEKKYIEYTHPFVEFVETDVNTGEINHGVFLLVGLENARIIRQDRVTVVVLQDGTKGKAKCHPEDTFNHRVGIRIAFNRALTKKLLKETKDLLKQQSLKK